ncbi:very short patch repair endonuclease [Micromonospora sp. NPDC005237]|uniref:very short patch repair endonuclease n=1 Tax=Micromonospora sp. NPDC005237 TaxID=3155113 RepID=UPI0033A906F8
MVFSSLDQKQRLPSTPPPSAASRTMRSNRSRDTKPELAVRRALFARGKRYRVGMRLTLPQRAVRPDIVFTRQRLAIFIDGCFWHGCPEHGRMPKDPTGYWHSKIDRNRNRDMLTDAALQQSGWRVARVWEHTPANEAVDLIVAILDSDPVKVRSASATSGTD